jgi:hypothetical protein
VAEGNGLDKLWQQVQTSALEPCNAEPAEKQPLKTVIDLMHLARAPSLMAWSQRRKGLFKLLLTLHAEALHPLCSVPTASTN